MYYLYLEITLQINKKATVDAQVWCQTTRPRARSCIQRENVFVPFCPNMETSSTKQGDNAIFWSSSRWQRTRLVYFWLHLACKTPYGRSLYPTLLRGYPLWIHTPVLTLYDSGIRQDFDTKTARNRDRIRLFMLKYSSGNPDVVDLLIGAARRRSNIDPDRPGACCAGRWLAIRRRK